MNLSTCDCGDCILAGGEDRVIDPTLPKIHQKLNGTESQRTPDQVSCVSCYDRYSGFFGVRETWVRPWVRFLGKKGFLR